MSLKKVTKSFYERADNMIDFANKKKEEAENKEDEDYWHGISYAWEQAKRNLKDDLEFYGVEVGDE